MQVAITERGPTVTEIDVRRFEKEFGLRLASPYRQFVLALNGGILDEASEVEEFHVGIERFHSLNGQSEWTDVAAASRRHAALYPADALGVVCIADTMGGDFLLLARDGQVLVQEAGYSSPRVVAPDFPALLDALTPSPEIEPDPHAVVTINPEFAGEVVRLFEENGPGL